ncbi:LysR family transcriptional regulator [Companilactobacillus sp. HBUAS56257]|uniref:LysR family transcriptional regulator n=1 Tax=Companilactobacillus sp. HBUAS56257 TaxID=3109360 RepID=UPI002FF30B13
MYNHNLDTFIIAAQTGSFSNAAQHLYISRSAVVQQINLLEKKLNLRLFIRTTHGISLTDAGQEFLIQAQKIRNLCHQVESHMKKYQPMITVGTSYLSLSNIFDKYWSNFKTENPESKVIFKEINDYKNVPEDIDIIDSVFAEEPLLNQGFDFIPCGNTPLVLAVPPTDSLAKKNILHDKDLENKNILLINPKVSTISNKVENYLHKHVKNINIFTYPIYNKSAISNALLNHYLIVVPKTLANICSPYIIKKIAWNFTAQVGFFYRKNPNELCKNFIDNISKQKNS